MPLHVKYVRILKSEKTTTLMKPEKIQRLSTYYVCEYKLKTGFQIASAHNIQKGSKNSKHLYLVLDVKICSSFLQSNVQKAIQGNQLQFKSHLYF